MLKLFRRIRQELLYKNNFKKYLLYAIGEIILVVVGILIALNINNRNEVRKAEKVERQYLLSLKEEFKQNLIEVDRVLEVCSVIANSTTKLADWTGPNVVGISEKEVALEIANTFASPPKYLPSPGVLNDLISSGNLNKLGNAKLRGHIQEWLVYKEEVKEEEEELWRHRWEVMDIVNRKMSFRKLVSDIGALGHNRETSFKADNTEILKDRYFENLLFFYNIVLDGLNDNHYQQLKNNIESILNEIELQLEGV